jgi:hypothetical protein
MFADKLSIKGLIIGIATYLAASVVAMIVIVQLWIPAGVTDRQELARLAENDAGLLMWQNIMGSVLGVFAGSVACHFSGAKGLKTPLILGTLLALYGVLGIYLHSDHPLLMQVGKILAPVPLVLLGGWLRLLLTRSSQRTKLEVG